MQFVAASSVVNMTNINSFIVLLCVLFFVLRVHSNRFRSYRLIIDRIEDDPSVNDNRYADFSEMFVRNYNKTDLVINGTVAILRPWPDDVKVGISTNEWSEADATFKERFSFFHTSNLCDLFENEEVVSLELAAHSVGTWNGKCPIDMPEIHIKEFMIEEDKLPEQFPGENWRFDAYAMHGPDRIAGIRLYFTVDRREEVSISVRED